MISDPSDNIDKILDDAKVNALTSRMDTAIVMMGNPVMYYMLPVVELCDVGDKDKILPEDISQDWQLLFIIDKDGDLAYTWVEGG